MASNLEQEWTAVSNAPWLSMAAVIVVCVAVWAVHQFLYGHRISQLKDDLLHEQSENVRLKSIIDANTQNRSRLEAVSFTKWHFRKRFTFLEATRLLLDEAPVRSTDDLTQHEMDFLIELVRRGQDGQMEACADLKGSALIPGEEVRSDHTVSRDDLIRFANEADMKPAFLFR